jgi:nicotinate-nucleotide adenylyltransferase
MARIGIYGGTYNPPHAGHIQAARSALELLKLDRLLLVPGFVAPHKMLPEDSPMPSQRLDMLKLASEGLQDIEVSDLELRREGVSYTYQTVEQLREENPDAELFLIMGADLFLSFDQWRCTEKILPEVTLAVLHRGEKGEKAAVAAKKAALESAGARVVLLENPVLDISSTQLRRMLVFECADPFLPAGVGEYIRQNGLYGTGKGYRCLLQQSPR